MNWKYILAAALMAIVFMGGLHLVGIAALAEDKDKKFRSKNFIHGTVFLFVSVLMAITIGYLAGCEDSNSYYEKIIHRSLEDEPRPTRKEFPGIQKAQKAPTSSRGHFLSSSKARAENREHGKRFNEEEKGIPRKSRNTTHKSSFLALLTLYHPVSALSNDRKH